MLTELSEQLETGGDPDAAAVEINAIKSQAEADVAAENGVGERRNRRYR